MIALVLRLHRSLSAPVGEVTERMRHWMNTANRHAGGLPREQLQDPEQLVELVHHLDATRGRLWANEPKWSSGVAPATTSPSQRLRLGSCKRSEQALVNDLTNFNGHVARFLKAFPRFASWQVEKVAIAPSLSAEARQAIETAGYRPQSLDDLVQGLMD